MKSTVVLSALLAIAAAAPSRQHKHHEHKRAVTITVIEYADADETTVAPVQQAVSVASPSTVSFPPASPTTTSTTPTTTSTTPTTTSTTPTTTSTTPTTTSTTPTTTSTTPTTTSSKSTTSTSAATSSPSSGLGDLQAFVNPTVPFQDGVHDCSTLPTGQGVVGVNWISGLTGGFTTIMNQNGDTSPVCQDGFYCSYACQAGMSKTQWPSEQPANGISMGGLYCKAGKLYRSNTNENFLCSWGKQTSTFVSKINKDVAICRTDYPGSENMNIPTLLQAGSTAPVSVVDSDNYYTWRGGKTSTQYYVNNAGVSIEDGCIWGNYGTVGNWAPVVLGAGYTGGNTYLSLIPNPNNLVAPNYNIKIEGTPGSTTVGYCSYENGQYLSGTAANGGSVTDGCTLTVSSGSANFVFY
ncbi:hypothetical protein JCM33374_g5460 [Metschnikowia sp. JCM 33374]|nr:hypothetical protein JCM33374_g5460 [Metschnikowia sp. JCM 33374]